MKIWMDGYMDDWKIRPPISPLSSLILSPFPSVRLPLSSPPHSPSIHASFPMTLSPSTTTPRQGDHDDDNEDDSDEYIDENVEH